jgi:hypothetical protein
LNDRPRFEQQFQRKLTDAGISGRLNVSKVGGVGCCGWVIEIGVVEDVEEFGVELEAEAFAWTEGEVL